MSNQDLFLILFDTLVVNQSEFILTRDKEILKCLFSCRSQGISLISGASETALVSMVNTWNSTNMLAALLDILEGWNVNNRQSLAYSIREASIQTLYQPFPIVSCLYTLSLCLAKLNSAELAQTMTTTRLISALIKVLGSSEPSVRKAAYDCLVDCTLKDSDSFWSASRQYLSGPQEKMVAIMAEQKASF